MRDCNFLSFRDLLLSLLTICSLASGEAFAEDPVYYSMARKLEDYPDVDPELRSEYRYLMSYCTEVRDNFSLSISLGPSVKYNNSDIPAIVVQFSMIPKGGAPAFIYVKQDLFYNDKANIKAGDDCLLSSFESASAQQITAILTTIAQTVGSVATAAAHGALVAENGAKCNDPDVVKQLRSGKYDRALGRDVCGDGLRDAIKSLPFNVQSTRLQSFRNVAVNRKFDYIKSIVPLQESDGTPFIDASGKPLTCLKKIGTFSVSLRVTAEGEAGKGEISNAQPLEGWHEGVRAYTPRPVMFRIRCHVAGGRNVHVEEPDFDLTQPQVLVPHVYAEWLNPGRDFFSNPTFAYTFKSNFLLGVDYSATSRAKSAVDLVSSPLRVLTPSVTITNQVTSSPGKPDTFVTGTQVAPPKGQ